MAYTKTNWQNEPSTQTPINATNLNNIETGIENNDKRLNGTTPMGNVVVDSIRSKNMFNKNNAEIKKFVDKTTGNISNSDDWSVSDFIEIEPSTNYIFSGVINSLSSIAGTAFYNSSKTFISGINSQTYTFTTPANAKYVRISLNTETLTQVQLEKGSTSTPYSPYQDLNIDYGKYAFIKLPSSQTTSSTAYQFQNVPFTNSPNFSSNSPLFEATSTGIKCKFSGTLLIFTMIAISEVGEINVKIGNNTYVSTGSRQNYCMSFINVNENDVVPLNFAYGGTLSLTIYDASILLLKL